MSPNDQHRRLSALPTGVLVRKRMGALYRLRYSSLRTLAALLIAPALAVACGASGKGPTGDLVNPAGEDSQQTSDVRRTTVAVEVEQEEGEGDFVTSGEGSGGEAGAADRIEGTRFRLFDGYERLLVDFGGKGGASGIPEWTVESPEEGGYVRIRFPNLVSTEVTHEDFVGSVLDELYVVRDRGGGLIVDVFAMHGFRYRVTEMPESGRLAIDFRSVSDEIRFPPTTTGKAVVLQPREAEKVTSPLDVRGYARLFEGQVTITLLDRDSEVLASEKVRANDWTEAWGLFETRLAFSGYEGIATLRVGSRSPKDGSFVGAETEIFLEDSGAG